MTDVNNPISMSLEVDELLFKVLLDNLYTNVHFSVIRELVANAIDSHRVAKNLYTPYKLQFPSVEFPQLILRDYGTGLSKEDVQLYLNRLLSSSKREEEDLTGFYGLGSKALLVLTDEYQVKSYFNGIRYDFRFVRENGGIPYLVFQGEEETQESNGIQYIVNFDENDNFNSFISSDIINFFNLSKLQPELYVNIQDEESKYTLDYPYEYISSLNDDIHYYLDKSPQGYSSTQGFVRVSGVCYPLIRQANFPYVFDRKVKLVIDVDPRYFELPLSRESIIYNQYNAQKFMSLVEYYNRTLKEKLTELIQKHSESLITFESINDVNYKSNREIELKVIRDFYESYNIYSLNLLKVFSWSNSSYRLNQLYFSPFLMNNFSAYTFIRNEIKDAQEVKLRLLDLRDNFISLTKIHNYFKRNPLSVADGELCLSLSYIRLQDNIISDIDLFDFFIDTFPYDVEIINKEAFDRLLSLERKGRARTRAAERPAALVGVRKLKYTDLNGYSFNFKQLYRASKPIPILLDEDGNPIPFGLNYVSNSRAVILKTFSDVKQYRFFLVAHQSNIDVFIVTDTKYDEVIQNCRSTGVSLLSLDKPTEEEISEEWLTRYKELYRYKTFSMYSSSLLCNMAIPNLKEILLTYLQNRNEEIPQLVLDFLTLDYASSIIQHIELLSTDVKNLWNNFYSFGVNKSLASTAEDFTEEFNYLYDHIGSRDFRPQYLEYFKDHIQQPFYKYHFEKTFL